MRFAISFLIASFISVGSSATGQEGISELSNPSVQSRISVPDKGISIIPPEGWSVQNNVPGATLFFKAPKEGETYERNIRIMSFVGPIYIDSVSFESFANKIKENSMKISNSLKNYQIRDLASVELTGGIKGGLFYADFLLSDIPMMQMHILVSSAKNHFLMTYTDSRDRFEEGSNGLLDEAYRSMQTVQLNSLPPARSDFVISIGTIVIATLSLLVGFALLRRRKMSQLGRAFEAYEDEPGDIVEEGETSLDDDEDSWNSSEGHKSGDDDDENSWFEGEDGGDAPLTEPDEHDAQDEVGVTHENSKLGEKVDDSKSKKRNELEEPDEGTWKL